MRRRPRPRSSPVRPSARSATSSTRPVSELSQQAESAPSQAAGGLRTLSDQVCRPGRRPSRRRRPARRLPRGRPVPGVDDRRPPREGWRPRSARRRDATSPAVARSCSSPPPAPPASWSAGWPGPVGPSSRTRSPIVRPTRPRATGDGRRAARRVADAVASCRRRTPVGRRAARHDGAVTMSTTPAYDPATQPKRPEASLGELLSEMTSTSARCSARRSSWPRRRPRRRPAGPARPPAMLGAAVPRRLAGPRHALARVGVAARPGAQHGPVVRHRRAAVGRSPPPSS